MLQYRVMQLSDIYLKLGQKSFQTIMNSISIGKLKTYQIFDQVKTRCHLAKLNAETLRGAIPRLWARLGVKEEELAKDLGQAILVSNLDLVADVLDFLRIPHEEGFFSKEIKPDQYLRGEWQLRVWDEFKGKYADSVLLFYINHLNWELNKDVEYFAPPT